MRPSNDDMNDGSGRVLRRFNVIQDEERKARQEREQRPLNLNHRLLMHEMLRQVMDLELILVES